MKMQVKSAGICATGTFFLATYPAMVHNENALNILFFSLPAAATLGTLGYFIGDILGNPKGGPSGKKSKGKAGGKGDALAEAAKPVQPITGDESFLDDLTADLAPAMATGAASPAAEPVESQ